MEPHKVFISLTQQDSALAEALSEAFDSLFGALVLTRFSTSHRLESGIAHGEDWFDWIVTQVKECDFALILLTPSSVQKPWILWEAGAVHGAAIAAGGQGLRKVRPLLFQVDSEHLPSPIRDSKAQYRRGDRLGDVEALFREVRQQYLSEMDSRTQEKAFNDFNKAVKTYLDRVSAAMMSAPMLPTSTVIEEWRLRLDKLLSDNRQSEAEYLHDWMDVAFGRTSDDQPQPLDLRIHTRLADLYLKAKKYKRGIAQLTLAQQLAPRDIFVLRTLGRAYLESDDGENAKTIIDRIEQLDKNAFVRNAECAALAGRWYRERGNLQRAAEIYATALDANQQSHYLANLLGEVRVEAREIASAQDTFRRALAIIEQLREKNVWTLATSANAYFVLGSDDAAIAQLRDIHSRGTDAGSLSTIEDGLRKLSANLPDGAARLSGLVAALR